MNARINVMPRWHARRVAAIVLGGFALLFLFGVAAGLLAGHLDAGSGARAWHDRLRWAIMLLPALALVAAGGWLWRRSRRAEFALAGGEAIAVRRSRNFWTVLGVQVVLGALVGGFGGFYLLHPEALPAGAAAWLTLVLAILALVAAGWGTIALYPRIDELELQDNLWAGCAATSAVVTLYPPWYLLWRGGWVAEPAHEAIFLALFAVMTTTYLLRKSRR